MKELVWKAGGGEVKWVFHGTPAAGNGVVGLLEHGCNVLTMCQDDHHKKHFIKAAVEKAAETCLCGRASPFDSPALLLRAKELHLVKDTKKDENKDDVEPTKKLPKPKKKDKEKKEGKKEEEKEKKPKVESKEEEKEKKPKKEKKQTDDAPVAKKPKVEKSSSSSSSSSSS